MHKVDYENPYNVKFRDLLSDAIDAFGEPRVEGSHHIFRMPWKGQPWVNLQRDGKNAKPYHVKQVKAALDKMKEYLKEESENGENSKI
ncbi:MAG: toxin HicA [Oligoflexales bacterium]|nr:toxin HicA [Oligoflexales bacterium]